MEPIDHSKKEEDSWDQHSLYGVSYSSRKRKRYHGFFDDYDVTRPDQSDKELLETYYSADVDGLPERPIDYWQPQPHRMAVLEAQFIRQGWFDEISQSESTPSIDVQEFGITPLERSRGILTGLAIGDALGRPIEFRSEEEIHDQYGFVDSFIGYGTHGQPVGTVTDDTEQALCIAASLASHGEWDPEDVATQFVDWYESGPFDIGRTTAQSMENLATNMNWEKAGRAAQSKLPDDRATNGSIMRCAPLAIAYPYDTEKLIRYSQESSVITHAHPRCRYGAAILNVTLANILTYTETPLKNALDDVRDDAPESLVSRLSSLEQTREADLSASGDVTDTLEAALYYGLTSSSFFEGVTNAVNMGGDTDTLGAITGAISGARFGLKQTRNPDSDKGVQYEQLQKTSTTGLRTLTSHIHELENGIGTFPKDTTWRDYISTIQNS